MPQPKRHHFNPILHLKHFTSAPKDHVWTYDAQTGEVRSATPENTAVETHFHSFERDDGSMDTSIEHHLEKVESRAAPVYDALIHGRIPTQSQQSRADFATFLALMYVRTPAMRRIGAELIGQMTQLMAYAYAIDERTFSDFCDRAEADGLKPLNHEERRRLRDWFLNPSKYHVVQVAKEKSLMVLGASDKLAEILFKMKWSVVIPLHGYFITSDNPVIREADPATREPMRGDMGFYNKSVEVIYPLSPQRLLLLTWNSEAKDIGGIRREHVEKINRGFAANSERCLYAHVRDKRIQRLAAEFRNSHPAMRVGGFGPKKYARVEVVRRFGRDRK